MEFKTKNLIYSDNIATTCMHQSIEQAMITYFTNSYWNTSTFHTLRKIYEVAFFWVRNQISELISSQGNEIIFTPGATKAIKFAIKRMLERSKKKKIVTVVTDILDIDERLLIQSNKLR